MYYLGLCRKNINHLSYYIQKTSPDQSMKGRAINKDNIHVAAGYLTSPRRNGRHRVEIHGKAAR